LQTRLKFRFAGGLRSAAVGSVLKSSVGTQRLKSFPFEFSVVPP
jgi:hypothetical protein